MQLAAIRGFFGSASTATSAAAAIIGLALVTTTLPAAPAVASDPASTGFVEPFAGNLQFVLLAPIQATEQRQINRRLGQKRADAIALQIGLRKSDVFTPEQYKLFITGGGVGGKKSAAELVDSSVRILTNTRGRALYSRGDHVPTARLQRSVLASYGLMVNTKGMLQSPANTDAPTRQINSLLTPKGYLATWCRANGARKSLRRLYRSAYPSEVVYGNQAQQQSGAAQLVTNTKDDASVIVGMSMAPALWIVNFALIYTLNPRLAAAMPGWWAPIPTEVATAIAASPTGQVPYRKYKSFFRHTQ